MPTSRLKKKNRSVESFAGLPENRDAEANEHILEELVMAPTEGDADAALAEISSSRRSGRPDAASREEANEGGQSRTIASGASHPRGGGERVTIAGIVAVCSAAVTTPGSSPKASRSKMSAAGNSDFGVGRAAIRTATGDSKRAVGVCDGRTFGERERIEPIEEAAPREQVGASRAQPSRGAATQHARNRSVGVVAVWTASKIARDSTEAS